MIETTARAVIAADDAIRSKLDQENYSANEVVFDVVAQSEQIWESVASEIGQYEFLETEFGTAETTWKAAWPEEPKPADVRNPLGKLFETVLTACAVIYLFLLLGFAIYEIYRNWGSVWSALWTSAVWIRIVGYSAPLIAGFFVLGILTSRRERLTAAQAADLQRRKQQWQQANLELRPQFGLTDLDTRMTAQTELIDARLAARVTQEIRSAINRRTEPSYAPQLDVERPRDFGEVSDSRFVVVTPARTRLQYLLENLSGGSIGIAGSRGAGKSTLLRTFCGEGRVIKKLKDRDTGKDMDVLGILVSAPVAYQAREFLLYLFGATCTSVLEAEKAPSAEPDSRFADPVDAVRELRAIPEVKRLPRALIRFGGILFLTGLAISLILTLLPAAGAGDVKAEPSTAAATAVPSPPPRPATASPASAAPMPTTAPTSAAAHPAPVAATNGGPDFAVFAGRWLTVMKVDPGTILGWGASAIVLGLLLGSVLSQSPLLLIASALPLGGLVWQLPPVRRARDRELEIELRQQELRADRDEQSLTPLARIASDRLKTIKFQQSYTSGWSGSLKLPVGLEGGTNRAVTLAQNQMSLPEISYAFARFIKTIAATYKVIIGIDELDKIATDELARQFINDIKSIFGLRDCFYLVSVSEDAMSSFERRGLPIRDEFDSAFDELIYVDHLGFELAEKLLEQRILGRPIPFFALSYCMSGGLPRDLIRNFRKILEIGGNQSGLSAVCDRLIADDIVAKARAAGTAARKINLSPQVDTLVEAMHQFEGIASSDAQLEGIAQAMLGATFLPDLKGDKAPPNSDKPAEEKSQTTSTSDESKLQQLRDLAEEIATYTLYVVSLRRFFTDALKQDDLIAAIDSGAIDKLAEARRYLGVNPAITRAIIKTFGEAHLGMPKSRAAPRGSRLKRWLS